MYLHEDAYPSSVADWPPHQRLALFVDINDALARRHTAHPEVWQRLSNLLERVRPTEIFMVEDARSGRVYVKFKPERMYRFVVNARGHCRIIAEPGEL